MSFPDRYRCLCFHFSAHCDVNAHPSSSSRSLHTVTTMSELVAIDNSWNYPVLPSDRSIRILRLEGGSKDDALVASVWVVSLDDPNRATYEAVSYV